MPRPSRRFLLAGGYLKQKSLECRVPVRRDHRIRTYVYSAPRAVANHVLIDHLGCQAGALRPSETLAIFRNFDSGKRFFVSKQPECANALSQDESRQVKKAS